MGAGTPTAPGAWGRHPSHAAPFLPVHQPLFFGSCSYRGLDTQPPEPLLTFPTCKISRTPGGMSQSLLDLPWDWQSCCSPTWGNPGAPPNHPGHILSVVCKQQLIALAGAGGFSLSGKPQEMVNVDPTTAAASLRGASPQPGWGHKPASISAALGSPPIFPPSSSRWAQDPQHLQEHHPGSPTRSPSSFSTLPSPGTASHLAGGTYLHALCIFLSERRGGR